MAKAGRDTGTWKRLRLRCFERDKAARKPCWLCGGEIDYTVAPSSTPESWEPDHRLSVKAHPELAEVPDNIYPAHKRCNRKKGDKAGVNNLGMPSRRW